MPTYEENREIERKDEVERQATEKRLAREVADLLGNDWEAHHKTDMDGRYWVTELHGPNAAELTFKVRGKRAYQGRGRIEISGHFPRDKKNGYYGPWGKRFEITVADTRPAADIAKEISRRLLPTYMPELVKAWERLNAAATDELKRDYFFQEFTAKLGEHKWSVVAPDHSPENRYYRSLGPFKSLDVRSYASHDSDVQIKFDCHRDVALELAAVFNCMTPAAAMEVTA